MAKRARKKRRPPILRTDPNAISLRSNSISWGTVLFDESQLKKFNAAKFDLMDEALRKTSKEGYNKLRRWAGRGAWMAVQSHPEILDGDGVPGLDLVFATAKKPLQKQRGKSPPSKMGKKAVGKSTKSSTAKQVQLFTPQPPKIGHWYEPLTQWLDIPSGRLRVVYEDQFFCHGFDQDESVYEISSAEDCHQDNDDFLDANSYLIHCEPGFYQAHAFTLFPESNLFKESLAPQLTIALFPVDKPKSFKMSLPILPYKTAEQDEAALRRSVAGLPVKESQPVLKPSLLDNGDFKASITNTPNFMRIEMPEPLFKKFGFKPGLLMTLEIEGLTIDGVAIEALTPDPTAWELIEKQKASCKNFFTVRRWGIFLIIELIKKSGKKTLNLMEDEVVPSVLRIKKDDDGQPMSIATKQAAAGNKNTIKIPKRVGKAGPKVAALIPKIEKCFSWTQYCLLVIDGQTMIGGVNVCPPQKLDSEEGDPEYMAAEISATLARVKNGVPCDETIKPFRQFPAGVNRAFEWVAKQAKGGFVWTNRFELELNFWNTKRSLNEKAAQADAIAAWKEVFGIE